MAKTMSNMTAAEHRIEEFAEDLGRLLGTARSKAEGWLGQRKQIVQHLEGIRDTATDLLGQLGHKGEEYAQGVVRRKRTMSAAARKAISDAQKRRWALQKAGEKKK